MVDEYELLPAEELDALREEVNILKKNSFGNTEEAKTLLEGIQQLNDNINRLIKVFSDVDQELVAEYNKVKSVDEQYHELQEQNKKIASGILTVANLVEDVKANAVSNEYDKGASGESGDVPDFKDVPAPPVPEQDLPSQMPIQNSATDQNINFNPVPPGSTPPPLTTGPMQGFGGAVTYQSPVFQDPFEKQIPQQAPVDPWAPQPAKQSSQQAFETPPMPGEQSALPNPVPPNMMVDNNNNTNNNINNNNINNNNNYTNDSSAQSSMGPPSPDQSSYPPPLPSQSSMRPPSPNDAQTPFSPPPDPFAGSGLSRPPPESLKKKGLFGLFS